MELGHRARLIGLQVLQVKAPHEEILTPDVLGDQVDLAGGEGTGDRPGVVGRPLGGQDGRDHRSPSADGLTAGFKGPSCLLSFNTFIQRATLWVFL